jgi:hypothetical protein
VLIERADPRIVRQVYSGSGYLVRIWRPSGSSYVTEDLRISDAALPDVLGWVMRSAAGDAFTLDLLFSELPGVAVRLIGNDPTESPS